MFSFKLSEDPAAHELDERGADLIPKKRTEGADIFHYSLVSSYTSVSL